MAFKGPGVPANGTPRSRARGALCAKAPAHESRAQRDADNAAARRRRATLLIGRTSLKSIFDAEAGGRIMDARASGVHAFLRGARGASSRRARRAVYSGQVLSRKKGCRMKSEKISELTTSRLSVYLRCLNLLASAGIKTISSQALADQFRLNSAQIRKDLAHFGEFGTRGVGYSVDELRRHLTKILGLDSAHRVGIVG